MILLRKTEAILVSFILNEAKKQMTYFFFAIYNSKSLWKMSNLFLALLPQHPNIGLNTGGVGWDQQVVTLFKSEIHCSLNRFIQIVRSAHFTYCRLNEFISSFIGRQIIISTVYYLRNISAVFKIVKSLSSTMQYLRV